MLDSRRHWGVSAKALLYRARELGALSESAFRRAMVSYNTQDLQIKDGSELGEPEVPLLILRSVETLQVAEAAGAVADDALVPRSLVEDLLAGSNA